jgi:hypothetical protein
MDATYVARIDNTLRSIAEDSTTDSAVREAARVALKFPMSPRLKSRLGWNR